MNDKIPTQKSWDDKTPTERREYLKGTSLERCANIERLVNLSWDEMSFLDQWSIVIAKGTR